MKEVSYNIRIAMIRARIPLFIHGISHTNTSIKIDRRYGAFRRPSDAYEKMHINFTRDMQSEIVSCIRKDLWERTYY